MVVIGQSVTLPVPRLAKESDNNTESHGEEEGAAESALLYSSDSDTDSVTQRVNFLIHAEGPIQINT